MADEKREQSPERATFGMPLWNVRLAGPVTPIVFFTLAMGGVLYQLGNAVEAFAQAGPWALAVVLPLIVLVFFILFSVVRLVRTHADELTGSSTTRRSARRLAKRG